MKTMPKLAHLTMFKDIVHCGSLHEAAKAGHLAADAQPGA